MKLKDFIKIYNNVYEYRFSLFSREELKVISYNYDEVNKLLENYGDSIVEEITVEPYSEAIEITVY